MKKSSTPSRGRLFKRYTALFVAVVFAALAINTIAEAWFLYKDHKRDLIRIQREQAEAAAAKISQFIKEIEDQIGWTTLSSWSLEPIARREIDAKRLLRQVPAITEFSQIDPSGHEQLRVSRVSLNVVGAAVDVAHEPAFAGALAHKVYFGPVQFRGGSEPYMTIAMAGNRRDTGVSVADVNLTFIWDVVSQIKVGQYGRAYVVDADNRLIAHPDMSLVLRNTDAGLLDQVRAARGEPAAASDVVQVVRDIDGAEVLSAHAPVAPLNWLVFVELPLTEAYAPLYSALLRSCVLFACALVVAVLAGSYLARRMVVPIRNLGAGAELIGQGKLGHRIALKTGDELEALGHQFNVMADRLQTSHAELTESHAKLEHRVEERTRDLARSLKELRALDEVSQAVNSTLDLRSVLTTIVAKAVELSGTEAGAIYVFDIARTAFMLSATHGMPDETNACIDEQPISVDHTLLEEAARRREALQIEDVTKGEPAAAPSIFRRTGYKALLVIPLLWSERIVGALVVQRRTSGRFEASTAALLRTFAAHSVLAIQNARLFSELQEQGRQLAYANEQKSRFLAAATHDLRQPLHALELWAGLLRNALTNPIALERWDKMYLSIVSLDTLFSGLLDLSRFDMGSIVPDVDDVSLRNLFRGIENDYGGEALAKGLELRVAETDLWIRTDPLWIERILRNLIANAIKYTERGVVSLSCEEHGIAMNIVVKDTGIGISASDQARIFEEYYQVDNPGRRRERGVGLGLAIVKRACELLDHPIRVQSELGVGSEFTIVVPKSLPRTLSNANRLRADEDASLYGFVVAVIDDDQNIADAMKALLDESGSLAVVGEDLDTVIKLLSSSDLEPQAILADYRLKNGLTGIEAIAQLRARYGDVPAALVTGEVDIVALQELDRAPYQVLRKPLDPPRIKAVLRSFRQRTVAAASKRIGRNEDLAGR